MSRRTALRIVGGLAGLLGLGRIPVAIAANEATRRFPIGISGEGRHFVDASGKPFLIHGDTAWSLIAELTREDAELYLQDRVRRGFNAILVSLIEHEFATHAPANAAGDLPFVDAPFVEPREAYFDHAHWVLERAGELGLLAFVVPAYAGTGGGGQGWYFEMVGAGATSLEEYGKYLGRRFGDLSNIVWTHGGDYNVPDKGLARAMVGGIAQTNPSALHAYHQDRDTSSRDMWAGEAWLDVDTVYTYGDVFPAVRAARGRQGTMPVLFIEGVYENEHNSSEQMVREIAYGALLGGAAGHFFGNNPIWHFSGPGLFNTGWLGWRQALNSRGAQSMTHLKALLDAVDWWTLLPGSDQLIHDIDPAIGARAFGAAARDGSLAIIYVSNVRSLLMSPQPISGRAYVASWYDPANGTFAQSETSRFDAEGGMSFEPPAPANSAGYTDWALLLRAG